MCEVEHSWKKTKRNETTDDNRDIHDMDTALEYDRRCSSNQEENNRATILEEL